LENGQRRLLAENPKLVVRQRWLAVDCSFSAKGNFVPASKSNVELKALSLLNTFEKAGKTVNSITIDGRRIQLILTKGETVDEFDGIDMRHGKA